jgi:hypothetical protein
MDVFIQRDYIGNRERDHKHDILLKALDKALRGSYVDRVLLIQRVSEILERSIDRESDYEE